MLNVTFNSFQKQYSTDNCNIIMEIIYYIDIHSKMYKNDQTQSSRNIIIIITIL